jgi:hypothetical protein
MISLTVCYFRAILVELQNAVPYRSRCFSSACAHNTISVDSALFRFHDTYTTSVWFRNKKLLGRWLKSVIILVMRYEINLMTRKYCKKSCHQPIIRKQRLRQKSYLPYSDVIILNNNAVLWNYHSVEIFFFSVMKQRWTICKRVRNI